MSLIKAILACAFFFFHTWLAAENVQFQRTPFGNTYAAGSEINLPAPIAGDLLAAGGKLRIETPVEADAALAGGTVEIRAPIGQDLRVVGGMITIAAPVGGDLIVAGGDIELQDAAHVTGPAWIAGSHVNFRGAAEQEMRVYARSFRLSGQIKGNAYIVAQHISFAPGARIEGNLRYKSPDPLASEIASMVAGTVSYESDIPPENPPEISSERTSAPANYGWAGFVIALLLALLIISLLTDRLFPVAVRASQAAYTGSPGKSLLVGAALFFSLPPVALLSLVTVIGIPVGLVLLALYPVVLLAGYLASLFAIASRTAALICGARKLPRWEHVVFLIAAILILFLLSSIPFAGGFILVIATTTGIGAWAISIYRRFWAHEA